MSQAEIPVVYPTPQINQPANDSHHSSNGSFGAVFIVLAVIVVISGVACFLGRLCNKRYHKADKQAKDHRGKEGKKQKQAFPKKEWEPKRNQTRDHGDIEFGFDHKKVPTAKVAASNNGEHAAMGPSRSFRNGDQMRFPGGDAAMGPGNMRFPGGEHATMGGPMRFPPGGDAMGPSRSFRNGEFKGEMRVPEGGGEHRAGPVMY